MEILSGTESVEELQKLFTEAFNTESSEQTPEEFRSQARLNAHQAKFAERFAHQAPTAWKDLLFLKPVAVSWVAHQLRNAIRTGDDQDAAEATDARSLLHLGINTWMRKYGIHTPWVYAMAFTTIRVAALSEFFSVDSPTTLLHNTFPTVTVKDGNVELGQSSFDATPTSTVIVCADLGMQEWDTLRESEPSFRNRMINAFTNKLNAQLGRVDHPLLAQDLEVKQHWIDMTIDRYAGHMSERATATKHNMSRPGVGNAVEATRMLLGFPELPPDWGATSPKPWRLHAT